MRDSVGIIEYYQKNFDRNIQINGILAQFMANLVDEAKEQSKMDDVIYG